MCLHLGDGAKLEQDFEKAMLVFFTHETCCIDQVLRDKEDSFENFRILIIQEITTHNKLNQLVHETIKLLGVPLGAVMDYSREGGKAGGDEVGGALALLICEMSDHHWEQILRLHIKSQQLRNLICSCGNIGLLVQDVFVDYVFEDLCTMRLNILLNTDDQIVQLAQTFLFQICF